jgi:hypothetical protein
VNSGAAAEAVATQAATLPSVARARARTVGSTAAPALRVTLRLTDDADVRAVLHRLDEEVLATVCSALDLSALPMAVRLEVERPHPCAAGRLNHPVLLTRQTAGTARLGAPEQGGRAAHDGR